MHYRSINYNFNGLTCYCKRLSTNIVAMVINRIPPMSLQLPPALPYFDTLNFIEDGNPVINQHIRDLMSNGISDASEAFEHVADWLLEQKSSENNFKTYRSEITTFLHYFWTVESRSIESVDRKAMNRYMDYCNNPPKELTGHFNVAQFVMSKDLDVRVPNERWRPFRGKTEMGLEVPYSLSVKAARTKLAILSSFFGFLIDMEYTERNPAAMLLNRNQYKDKSQSSSSGEDDEVKSLSSLQWSYVMTAAENLAEEDPVTHERTLFLMSLMYACYPRISEVSSRPGYTPQMKQFRRDPHTGVWVFHT